MGVPPQAGSGHSRAEPEEVSVVPTSVPNASDVFALANKKAKKRYPNGTGATALADLVREAARDLGYTSAKKPCERAPNPNEGRHNILSLLPDAQQAEARRICAERTADDGRGWAPCTDRDFVCYACQDLAASAIKAAAAGETTQIGSTEGESATRQGDAQSEDPQ